jgi:SAM-dependent methyltransferase
VLTIRFDQLGLRAGDRVLDVGAGFGRHVFECARLGGRVVALDYAPDEVIETRDTLDAMVDAGEVTRDRALGVLRGDARRLPFPDACFDAVITSEVLEHIQDDVSAITEMVRVLKPGGHFAATVPSWLPETINWRLSDEYHAPKSVGGHVRIYTRTELRAKLRAAGLEIDGHHRSHALHSPYWWLKCAVGIDDDDHPVIARYRRFLEWDIVSRPLSTRIAEKALSPVLGKSSVHYATKPLEPVPPEAVAVTADGDVTADTRAPHPTTAASFPPPTAEGHGRANGNGDGDAAPPPGTHAPVPQGQGA